MPSSRGRAEMFMPMLPRLSARMMPTLLHDALRRWRHTKRCAPLYAKHQGHTMVPVDQFADNLWLCRELQLPPGCVIECGVWRGGMSAAMAEVLGPGRAYYLFDSFEGLPPALAGKDEPRALGKAASLDPAVRLVAEMQWAERAMRRSGATRYELVPGWFKETLANFVPPEPVAVLRLDGDFYDSTLQCLEALFPHVPRGGLVLIDDYYVWDGCARAIHEYLSQQPGQDRIQQTPAGVAYIHKA